MIHATAARAEELVKRIRRAVGARKLMVRIEAFIKPVIKPAHKNLFTKVDILTTVPPGHCLRKPSPAATRGTERGCRKGRAGCAVSARSAVSLCQEPAHYLPARCLRQLLSGGGGVISSFRACVFPPPESSSSTLFTPTSYS